MNVFLDTNILVDFVDNRDNQQAEFLLQIDY